MKSPLLKVFVACFSIKKNILQDPEPGDGDDDEKKKEKKKEGGVEKKKEENKIQ